MRLKPMAKEWSMKALLTGTLIGAGLTAGIVGLTAIAAPSTANDAPDPRTLTYQQLDLFAEILTKARADYVVEIDEEKAIEAAINGMLVSLDPHSGYMNAEDFSAMDEEISGEYGGLGIEVTLEEGFIKVIAPTDGSPASRAGLKPGDLITHINQKPILGLTLNDAVRQMRGPKGTSIEITVLREGEDAFDVALTREVIQRKSVSARIEGGNIGYLRISTFDERTTELLKAGIADISAKTGGRPKGIILDVRNNGGGLLEEAVSVSDFFLPGGEVVSTKGRRPQDAERRSATAGEAFKGVPMVVLINGGSASASEIVAGALQDRARATLVGETSFGKGSVQSVIPLGADRGAIRLTTSRYYTPSGRSIQALGIEPDIMITQARLTEAEIARLHRWSEADLPNALRAEGASEDEILSAEERAAKVRMPDEQPPEAYKGEDFQLERAVQMLQQGNLSAVAVRRAG
jgi:carboxyl-terminal processing protease